MNMFCFFNKTLSPANFVVPTNRTLQSWCKFLSNLFQASTNLLHRTRFFWAKIKKWARKTKVCVWSRKNWKHCILFFITYIGPVLPIFIAFLSKVFAIRFCSECYFISPDFFEKKSNKWARKTKVRVQSRNNWKHCILFFITYIGLVISIFIAFPSKVFAIRFCSLSVIPNV